MAAQNESTCEGEFQVRGVVMSKKLLLLARLKDIGQSLAGTGHGLALFGLGSVGIERDRLDEYSDLDFFVIVEEGYKRRFIDNLEWLSSVCGIAYGFRNTDDGHKVLFEDGVFCEFAVFEPAELPGIPFARGQVVWKQPHVDDSISIPANAAPTSSAKSVDWLIGETLTNLYVGLCRYCRGEKLSATRFIQGHAVDRTLELAKLIDAELPVSRDDFANERRYEQRFPSMTQELPNFIQGYERSQESARAILSFLEKHFAINAAMAKAIRELCGNTD
jgi:hypothetical protein